MTPLSRRLDVSMCSGCLEKMREIDRLKRKVDKQAKRIAVLENRLGQRLRSTEELPFGESTPSSMLPFKSNASDEDRQRKGGAKRGHKGHGRKVSPGVEPPERLSAPDTCPGCGGKTTTRKVELRHVRDYIPARVVDRSFLVETCSCQACGRHTEAPVPDVAPRGKYTITLLAEAAAEHYLLGRTQGDVCQRLGIGRGAFNNAMHSIADDLDACMDTLVRQFLADPVRFGDETGFREDGVGRYAWLLSTWRVSLFLAGQSRASSVPLDLIAKYVPEWGLLPGVLVVDRYAAYNCLPFHLQYCYAHLLRDVRKLEKRFPKDREVRAFCRALARQLAAAMKLRKKTLSDCAYYAQAEAIKAEIIRICESEASHPEIQQMQNIFRKNPHRLYHWARDRRVPADNNYSERSLRPLVIARKISFGTQSARGSRTRTVIMSVLHSLKKQGHDPVARLAEAIRAKADNPDINLADFLFPANSLDSIPHLPKPQALTADESAPPADSEQSQPIATEPHKHAILAATG